MTTDPLDDPIVRLALAERGLTRDDVAEVHVTEPDETWAGLDPGTWTQIDLKLRPKAERVHVEITTRPGGGP